MYTEIFKELPILIGDEKGVKGNIRPKPKNIEGCEYCNLLSGCWSVLSTFKDNELRIERHNNTYEITTSTDCCEYNKLISYCPMCR